MRWTGLALLPLVMAAAGGAPTVVYEADFEAATTASPPPGWSMWGAEQWKDPANFTRDTTQPHSGAGCLRIHHPANTAGYLVSSPETALRPATNQLYTITFWARGAVAGTASFRLTAYETINPFRDAPTPGAWALPVTPAWREFRFTLREGLDFHANRSAYLMLTFLATSRNADEQTLFIDDLRITAEPRTDTLRLVDESTLQAEPVPQRLEPGERLEATVDLRQRLRPAVRAAGGISFHRLCGWTGEPYDREGRLTLHPETIAALRELQLPLTRIYGVGHEPFGLEAGIDKAAELGQTIGVPLDRIVLELEEQSANRKIEPADWARAVRYAHSKGYGFRYWEVANEPFSSTWGTGMGQAFPDADAYLDHVIAVSKAVKAVDPQAQVGMALADNLRWGAYALARAAGSYDFVAPHYYAGFGQIHRRRFEAVTVADNHRMFARIQRTAALLRASNPDRPVVQLDTEWGLHSSGPNGERADVVRRNGNSWGMLHRAVRMIHYAREGLLAGASSWCLSGRADTPGFGIIARNAPDRRYLMYWLYQLFNQHVGDQVVAIRGQAPWFTPTGDDPAHPAGQYAGALTPLLATLSEDGRKLALVVANAALDQEYPATLTIEGGAVTVTAATLLRQDDPEADPLLASRDEAVKPLAVQSAGGRLTFRLPGHSVAFIAAEVR